jgi:DNA-binding beta-propeller fold protein YncE
VNRLLAVLVAGAAVAGAVAGPAASAGDRPKGDTRVFAKVAAPGYPALSLVTPDDRVYVGTFTGVGGDTSGPSKVFAYSAGGRLRRTYAVRGQTPDAAHAVQVAARDRAGRLYLLDQNPARVVVLDPRTGAQHTWATFLDLPQCQAGSRPAGCSNTALDNPPEPDYAAWLPDGSLAVTDYAQQLIWRVPRGGGKARVWMNDLRLDGEQFGPAGLVMMRSRRSLLLTVSAGGVLTSGVTDNAATGKLYRIDIDGAGHAQRLTQLWASRPGEAPDGFAVSRAGHVYVALSGPTANAVAELAPDATGGWREVWRTPTTAVDGLTAPVMWDTPTSVQFLGDRLLVTNQAYFTGDSSHWAVFDVAAHERGLATYVPRSAVSGL